MEWPDDSATIVTQWEGIRNKFSSDVNMLYAKGCNINDTDSSGFAEAIAVSSKADIVIMSIGEARDMSGEAKSRSNPVIPGVQEALVKNILATGKPVVVMINAGRPLLFGSIADKAHAILYTWWLGSQAGNAIAAVLTGDYNPSGKITMSFPRNAGQMPIYYNHLNTGHPAPNDSTLDYVSGYIDLPHSPRFPFGYGLSYTSFAYSDIKLSKTTVRPGEKLEVSVVVTNSGNYDGEETVQLYIRDMVASVVRPVKELKGFQKIFLKRGESGEVKFRITIEDLKFYNNQLQYVAEPGDFKLFIGTNSEEVKEASFKLVL